MHEHPAVHIPSTQRAIVSPTVSDKLNAVHRIIPVGDPKPGEAMVRLLYTGICRSDVSFSIGPYPGFPSRDYIAGHEGLGHVVKAHDPSILGKLVGIRYLGSSCQRCVYCLRGLPTSCPTQVNIPRQVMGTFQQFVTLPVSCLLDLPNDLIDGGIPLQVYTAALCSGSTALAGLKMAEVGHGDVILVMGILGAIGHLTGSIAKHVMGAKVIGVDLKWKIDQLPANANHFGDVFLPAPEASSLTSSCEFQHQLSTTCTLLRKHTSFQRNADVVIVASSCAEAFESLENYVCDGGRIVCLGVPKGRISISTPVNSLVERNLRISGTLMGGHQEALEVISYIQSGLISPLTETVPLSKVPEQMQRLLECKVTGKIVVEFNNSLKGLE
ncbi:unnamed protein product [Clonostachys byssicola]|uniref:alcohol dehydrogenase n=1 Tax=Clonostachys byssicola TaxID=160290 RepID=A0A9N9U7V5_9HYPO|nr:unnamed protein product [Clonostachys byssicola]